MNSQAKGLARNCIFSEMATTGFGSKGRDKLWPGYEVTDVLKKLAEYYDDLFRADLTGKANEQQPTE